MVFLKGIFRLLIAVLAASFATIATPVQYEWNGEAGTRRTESAFVDYFAGVQTIAAAASAENSGWLNFTNCGRPFCQLTIEARGTGLRNVEVIIEYARLFDGQLLKTTIERKRNLADVDYSPKTLLWNIPLSKTLGVFARVKAINNDGDMTIVCQALGPASAMPVDTDTIPVLDYEIIEEDLP